MKAVVSTLVLVALCAAIALAANGGDVSQYYGTSTWSCAKNHGWDFVIVRSYCSYGGVDPNVKSTLDAAKAGGIKYRDIYHFPCYGKVSAAQQIHDDIDHVGKDNFGTIWLDIESNPSPGCGWDSDHSKNCQFIRDMISAAESKGARVGVYSSVYEWGLTAGSGCTAGSDKPLWYADYDGTKSFGGFTPFGGWHTPAMKQYGDSVGGVCGINADADWY